MNNSIRKQRNSNKNIFLRTREELKDVTLQHIVCSMDPRGFASLVKELSCELYCK